MIDRKTIDEIFGSVQIDEVISDFVNLKKRGANLLGLCPFHDEKTPSFTVSPAKQIYKCFGCGKAGNAVNFIMEHEHYSYPEALKYLAKKYNIAIEETEPDAEELAAKDKRESLLVATNFAHQFFQNQLHETDEGRNIGLSYFKERSFTAETIKKFELGYSPEKYDAFSEEALKNKFEKEILTDAGLCLEKGEKLIDRFRERMMFPIHNQTGRVIAFGGRALRKDVKAKYINSPETELYNKSKVLYGIYFARKTMVSEDNCYLVEGYTDVISFHQSGVENVVASSGTSLTDGQIKLIKRFTENITILYDGDAAGIKASFRGIDMILEAGMNVKIVLFPEGEDPDSFAKTHSQEELQAFLKEKQNDFIRFKTEILSKDIGNDPIKKAEMISELVKSIAKINDHIKRSLYIKDCSTFLNIPEAALINELNRIRRKSFKDNIKKQQREENQLDYLPETEKLPVENESGIDAHGDSYYQERDIIRILLNYGNEKFSTTFYNDQAEKEPKKISVAQCCIYELFEADKISFNDPVLGKILEEYHQPLQKGEIPDSVYFTTHHDEEITKIATDLLSSHYEIHNWEKHNIMVELEKDHLENAILTAIFNLKLRKIDEGLGEIQKELKYVDNEDAINNLVNKFAHLKQVQMILAEKLGRVITE